MWTKPNAAPPSLVVNPAITVLAEISEPKIEPRDKGEGWNEDEQRERLMPLEQCEDDERAENDTCADSNATMPQPLLVG